MSASKAKEKLQKTNEFDEKIRILCLHGYRQNGQTFKVKMGKFKIVFSLDCVH